MHRFRIAPRRLVGPQSLFVGIALLALGLLSLAGCSANTGADLLLAARVNGNPITLAQYDSMLRFSAASAALQGQTSDLQSASGRSNFDASQQSAFSWLISRELAREKLVEQKMTVTPAEQKGARDFVDSYKTQVKQQLTLQPDNTQLRELQASITPDVTQIITDRLAGEQALADQSKFPTAHVRAIYVDTQDQATKLLQQVHQGADFGQLARAKSIDPQSAAKGGDLGTVYIGQISTEFNQAVFAPHAHPQQYVIAPVGTKFGLFEVTSRSEATIAKADQQQLGLQVVESWFSTVVQPSSHVEQYVSVH